jgi:hypothetical protein
MNSNKKLDGLKVILSYKGLGPRKVMYILFFYSFTLFMMIHLLSIYRNGAYKLSEKFWIIVVVCGACVEILNQITYYWAKKKHQMASIVKGIVFWLIFTIGCIMYVYLLSGLEVKQSWVWSEQIGYFIIYLCLSWMMPIYSFTPNVRFIFLYGKYKTK